MSASIGTQSTMGADLCRIPTSFHADGKVKTWKYAPHDWRLGAVGSVRDVHADSGGSPTVVVRSKLIWYCTRCRQMEALPSV